MYLGIDIGGTKTLLAVFSADGQRVDEHRFPTNPDYGKFVVELDQAIKNELAQHNITACCCAVAGFELDRERGVVPTMGNLPWKNITLLKDLQQVLPQATVFIENDAKLAGLSEALNVKNDYQNVLYLTLGTGVGMAHIQDGLIDLQLSDKGGRGLVLDHEGQLIDWDDLASGKALVKRYGQTAAEIDDPKIWTAYADDIAQGLIHFIETVQPQVVIVGGGVGAYFEKFAEALKQTLLKLSSSESLPVLLKAKRPEEAVIYGCYDYLKQKT